MTNLEIELKAVMVKSIVRYPDGLERINAALEDVIQTGIEMMDEQSEEFMIH